MRAGFKYLAALGLVLFSCAVPSWAAGNDWNITDGQGEALQIKHGLFGKKQEYVQDRLGDKFYNKKGLFGTKETDVSLLGNTFSRKKGLLGHTDYQGKSIFGDTVRTKKGLFGRRKTEVNVSGISNAVRGLMNGSSRPLAGALPGGAGSLAPMPAPPRPLQSGSSNPLDQDIMRDPQ